MPRFRSLGFSAGVASLTIVGLAVGVGGCTAAHSAGSPAPSRTASPRADRALLAKVLPVPSTAAEQMVFGSSLGVYSLDQFAQHFYPKDPTRAAKDLRADGFVLAAERAWTGNDGRDASVQLIQFQEPSGASTYVGREELAFERNTADVAFAVPSVDHGRGYENPKRDEFGYVTATMLGERGDLVIRIELSTKGAFDRPAEIALMHQQVAALAAHP